MLEKKNANPGCYGGMVGAVIGGGEGGREEDGWGAKLWRLKKATSVRGFSKSNDAKGQRESERDDDRGGSERARGWVGC